MEPLPAPPNADLRPLPRSFFLPSAKQVAPRLLGHYLLRRTPDGLAGGRIVETEAYLKNDPACHAYPGLTNRNRSMWGSPGRAYVYLIYGFHFCFNAVCCPEGHAEAVLIRAVDVTFGAGWMHQNRQVARETQLTSGPGKLCAALKIDRSLDSADLCNPNSDVFIAENRGLRAFRRAAGPIVTTTRIGLTQAADWPLRFYLGRSPFLSKPSRSTTASKATAKCNLKG